MICNICGNGDFECFRDRGPIRCSHCGSIERTRMFALFLEKYVKLKKGMRVLHFAPERQLFLKIFNAVGQGYSIRDLDVERYSRLLATGIQIEKFDLCNDLETLPTNHYDLILHNHVLEHLPCNITAVLWHLHRSLNENGLHLFSVPMTAHYEEKYGPVSADDREKSFKHSEHIRIFGRRDLAATLGMIFEIEDQIAQTPRDRFGSEVLERYNIPEDRWDVFDGASLFVLTKSALKLRI